MITLKTPTKEVIKELHEEEDKAIFWLKKHYHGQKGYERMQETLMDRCNMFMKDQRSDIVEYISPKGNRWLAFEHCRYHKSICHGFSMVVAFCYYETYGSCGAFLVAHDMEKGDKQGAIMFTDHFFLRFCQRLGVEMRSRWMIQRFVEVIPGFTFSFGEKNENGFVKVDCRLPASIGRGILRKDGYMIEIRTYLTDKELNNKQLRETARLRAMADRQSYEPLEVRQARLLMSDDFSKELEKELTDSAEMAGLDKGDVIAASNIIFYIIQALIDLGYAQGDDIDFWQRFRDCMDYMAVIDFVEKYSKGNSDAQTVKILYDQIEKIGTFFHIKKYDAVKVMDKTIEFWQKHVDEYLKEKEDA